MPKFKYAITFKCQRLEVPDFECVGILKSQILKKSEYKCQRLTVPTLNVSEIDRVRICMCQNLTVSESERV